MRSTIEKIVIIEVISVCLAVVIGLFAMIQGYLTLLLLTFFLIAIGLACEAFIYLQKRNLQQHAIMQIVRAVCIFFFVTYLLFQI